MSPLTLLLLGAGVLMLVGAGVALLAGGRGQNVEDRLEDFVGTSEYAFAVPEDDADTESLIKADSSADKFDKALAGRGIGSKIRERIAKADLKLRVAEYVILQIVATIGVGFAAYFFFNRNMILGILGALLGLRLPRIYTSMVATRRLRAFDNQLSDTLNLWVNSLRSGYSVLQGMEAIATELPAPVSTEFERVVQEVRLGLSLTQALDNMVRRIPSEDLDLVVTAVNIQREVGGNLAEILAIISFTIRERVRIKGEIRTLTAQGRISGWVVGLLPVGLALILYRINPGYVSEIWVKEPPYIIPEVFPCGWIVIGLGMVMVAAGVFAIMKIVDIEV